MYEAENGILRLYVDTEEIEETIRKKLVPEQSGKTVKLIRTNYDIWGHDKFIDVMFFVTDEKMNSQPWCMDRYKLDVSDEHILSKNCPAAKINVCPPIRQHKNDEFQNHTHLCEKKMLWNKHAECEFVKKNKDMGFEDVCDDCIHLRIVNLNKDGSKIESIV